MKKEYISLEIDLVLLDTQDIVRTSSDHDIVGDDMFDD
jgi:hypothetical protein